jgi:hypothetical protein
VSRQGHCGFRSEDERESWLKANSDSDRKANGFRPSPESFSQWARNDFHRVSGAGHQHRHMDLARRNRIAGHETVHVMWPSRVRWPLCQNASVSRRAHFFRPIDVMLERLELVHEGDIGLPRGFRGIFSSAAPGIVHLSEAACLVRRVISAYRLVVSKVAWPS